MQILKKSVAYTEDRHSQGKTLRSLILHDSPPISYG